MLDYIKQRIAEMQKTDKAFEAVQEQQAEAQTDELILECAHLVQELDDLTMDGTEAGSSRPFTKVDIPIEDDIEVTTVEMSLLDGRVTNVPMDATVQESDTVYVGMKTPDDFFNEAYSSTQQYQRETMEQFTNRVKRIASENYREYKSHCIQEGLFGFDKIHLSDERVPTRVIMECGNLSGKDYTVKLGVDFESGANHQIMKKQLDSVIAFRQSDLSVLQEAAFEAFGENAGVQSSDYIWNVVTPTRLIVPKGPSTNFHVVIECEIDGTADKAYLEWSLPIDGGMSRISVMSKSDQKDLEMMPIVIGKNTAIHVEAEMAAMGYRAPSRFVQEAIDFGDPNAAPAANPDAPAVSFDAPPADGAQQPTADAGGAPPADGTQPATDASADGMDQSTDPNADPTATDNGEPKEQVDTNNVSDQIAEKVADETQADANADADLSIDGVDATSDVDATPSDSDIDAELGGDGSSEDTTSTEPAETTDVDFDNMTIDELLAQGQEKMKTMTMQELKDFLQSGKLPTGGDMGSTPEEPAVTEAFYDTILEAARTNRDNVKNRIANTIDDMNTNLKKIHKVLSKDDATRREVARLWSSVKTSDTAGGGTHLTGGIQDGGIIGKVASAVLGPIGGLATAVYSISGGFSTFSSSTTSGEEFEKSVNEVLRFLKVAVKRKKVKSVFTEDEQRQLNQYYQDILDMKKIITQAMTTASKQSRDVSLKQVDNAIMKVVNQYDAIKSIVSGSTFTECVIEEAFFLTRGNIGKELDIHLRKALGILNDNEMEIEQLCTQFRKEGKQLNRVVHKASTMKKVFNETECKQLLKLNQCLTDLLRMLRPNIDKNSIMTVKRMIQAFVQEATGVLGLIEQKNGKPVQEGFLDLYQIERS